MGIVPFVMSDALSVLALVGAALAIIVAVASRRRLTRLVRDGGRRSGDRRGHESRVPDLRALRDLAIVRYDALHEMSGQLSFSLAMLNAAGDGIVLSSINGRADTRTYAKAVVAGKGTQELSPEEEEAVRAARLGTGPNGHAAPPVKPKITSATGTRRNVTAL